MQDWVEKYRPKSLQDIVGNKQIVRHMAEWAGKWEAGKPPLLIYGKPGTGKTSSAYALANDMNWEVVELNASDQRTKGIIERIAGSTATTMSLTGASRKLLLLDEADNLHGTADRGGARAIMDVIKNSRQPIILIANDIYGVAKELKFLCEPVQFRALQARSIVPHLKYICSKENKKCSDEALTEIAESSSGDMRSAINMLYAAGIGTENLTSDDVNTAKKDERSTIFELVGAVLKGREDKRLMEISYELSDTPDAMEQWIEGSLGQIKDISKRAEAYRYLSLADEFIGRTYRRQYYTLWRYATSIMVLGTASAAGGAGVTDRIMPPSRWGLMSRGKKQKAIRQFVLNKLSSAYHVPEDTLRDDYLKPVSIMADRDPLSFAKELSLDKDELDFFIHDKTRSSDVIKEIKKEEREAEKRDKKAKKDSKKKIVTLEKPAVAAEIPSGDNSIMTPAEAGMEEKKPEDTEKKPPQTQSTLFSF